MKSYKSFYFILLLISLNSCFPQAGPDKTASGAILGGAWGAGAGLIVGNQIGNQKESALVGAGIGAVSGVLSGASIDLAEGSDLEADRNIRDAKDQATSNSNKLTRIYKQLDLENESASTSNYDGARVFFESGSSVITLGNAKELERVAKYILKDKSNHLITISGHSDDLGDEEINSQLSKNRAEAVAAFLMSHGVSESSLKLNWHGSKRPIASNKNPSGRQLNRRVEVLG